MIRNRVVSGGALVSIMLVISIVGIACGGSASQPAGSPAASGPASSENGSGAEGQAYRSVVVQRIDSLDQSLEELSVLLLAPQMRDPDWKSRVETELSTWRDAAAEARGLTPPDAYRAFHEKYLAGLSQFEEGAGYLETGIANQNLSAVGEARGQIMMAGKTVSDASSLLPKQ